MNEIYCFIISYVLVIGIAFFLINFLSNGFLTIFIKVKASRGKKILINVKSKIQHYFISGEIQGEMLVYHDRESKANKQKTPKMLCINNNEVFYRAFGVNCVNIDEATNNFIKPSGENSAGFDAVTYSNLYIRALTKPTEDKNDIIIKLLIGVIILVISGLGFLYFKMVTITELIESIKTVSSAVV